LTDSLCIEWYFSIWNINKVKYWGWTTEILNF